MRRILNVVLACLIAVMICGLTSQTVAAAKEPDLDGRLGSTTGQFAKKYGDPTEEPAGGEGSYRYENKNYRSLQTEATNKRVHRVSFYSDEPGKVEKMWTVAEATRYAKRFLPADAACNEPLTRPDREDLYVNCHSVALEPIFDETTLADFDASGVPGDVGYTLALRNGDVFTVVIQAGLVYEPEPASDANARAQDTAYPGRLKTAHFLLLQSFDQFEILSADPQPTREWETAFVGNLAHWQLAFGSWSDRDPPEEYADLHARWLGGLSLLNTAADQLIYGLHNSDSASMELGLGNYRLGRALVEGMADEIDAL